MDNMIDFQILGSMTDHQILELIRNDIKKVQNDMNKVQGFLDDALACTKKFAGLGNELSMAEFEIASLDTNTVELSSLNGIHHGVLSCDEVNQSLSTDEVINDEVTTPYMNETTYITDVELLDKGYITEPSNSGICSALEIKMHDTTRQSQNLQGCSCFHAFDPGISIQRMIIFPSKDDVVEVPSSNSHDVQLSCAQTAQWTTINLYCIFSPQTHLLKLCLEAEAALLRQYGDEEVSEGFQEVRVWSYFPVFDSGIRFTIHGVSYEVTESPLDFGSEDHLHIIHVGALDDTCRCTLIKLRSLHNPVDLDLIRRLQYPCLPIPPLQVIVAICQAVMHFLSYGFGFDTYIIVFGAKGMLLSLEDNMWHFKMVAINFFDTDDAYKLQLHRLDHLKAWLLLICAAAYGKAVHQSWFSIMAYVFHRYVGFSSLSSLQSLFPSASCGIAHAFNVINGGSHTGNKVAMQEFETLPTGASTFKEGMKMGVEVYHHLKAEIGEQVQIVGADLLVTNPKMVDYGYITIRLTVIRDYDGFNGPGFLHVAFDFVLALMRDYDGFNGPGHLGDKVSLRGGLCYGITSIRGFMNKCNS